MTKNIKNKEKKDLKKTKKGTKVEKLIQEEEGKVTKLPQAHDANLDLVPEDEEKEYKILDMDAFKKFLVEVKDFLFATSLEKSGYLETCEKELNKQVWNPVKFGFIVILMTIGFFAVWGGLAPLDSASMAPGYVVLSKSRKIIQHLEGGVIEKILVKDGDYVEKGQPLLILNSTRAKANLNATLWRLRYAVAVEKRLTAQEMGEDKIDFQSKYLDLEDPDVKKLIDSQAKLFETRKELLSSRVNSINAQIDQAYNEIKGYEKRYESETLKLNTARENYENALKLYNKNLDVKSRLNEYKIRLHDSEGMVSDIKSKIASLKHTIARAEAERATIQDEYKVETSREYRENHEKLLQYEEGYQEAQDTYKRTIITAPRSGIVTGLVYHTVGGVIPPNSGGGKIMEIIPQDDKLIIQAEVKSQDIESIKVGNKAKIQLGAYKSRLVPRIEGTVIYVAPDLNIDQQQRNPNQPPGYTVKIEIKKSTLAKVNADITLYPGMPATVFVVKGTRTFLEYLISPILDSFHKAFKEA